MTDDETGAPAEPATDEAYEALETDVLSADAPEHDSTWPNITPTTDDDMLGCVFPDAWSDEPTERDQAAIDAGNADATGDES